VVRLSGESALRFHACPRAGESGFWRSIFALALHARLQSILLRAGFCRLPDRVAVARPPVEGHLPRSRGPPVHFADVPLVG